MTSEPKNAYRGKAARSAASECRYRLKGLIAQFGSRAAPIMKAIEKAGVPGPAGG